MSEFFLEIGTEEIPSGYIEPALDSMRRELKAFFEKNHIPAQSPQILGTPRRLVVAFAHVEPRQEDVVETHLGPNVKAAYDADGNPTKAASGFARGKGMDVSDLTVEMTAKGEVLCARIEKKGQPTSDLLNAFLPQLIGNIHFPKKMRWGGKKVAFARPIHWIAALLGEKPLDFEFGGIPSGEVSYGHRFLKPAAFPVKNLATYLQECEKHFLAVEPEARKKLIAEQAQALAEKVGGVVEEDSKLLNQVACLVEYPVAILGDYDPEYLKLPKELLVMTMKYHQKYFPVSGPTGELMPHFITISNMIGDGGAEIKKGNERVLKARLEDARFFFEEDRKRTLEDFVEELKGVVFQKKLGTTYEKMTRFSALAVNLAEKVCPDKKKHAERAAWLCKADLVSQMVYEFPELQGIMGGYYAAAAGEAAEVVQAIKEHYRPAFAGDRLPDTAVGAVVAIGDKLDTILGCIGVGLIPTGSEDPYGLRRHALGIIQIVLAKGWQFSFNALIDAGVKLLAQKIKLQPEEIRQHTLDLFSQRYKSLLTEEEHSYDAIDAILSTGIDSLVDVKQKVIAFSNLKSLPHFEPLAIAFRRIVSILNEEAPGEIQTDLLADPAEKELYAQYLRVKDPVQQCIEDKDFAQALEKIVEIKGAVDDFFDQVMVMVEEDALRKNRLHLLYGISRLFANIADFSKIVLKRA
ncbi:MAG: glycine--tRNA ligase subunit beta [Nitrospinae bacterium]|jgi:glycyl-tRNA synthetase beta chain|nr:glycine--tRNA ligase subunit beta [Nitrospinota bacterium]MDA1109487.1 glycine--tRNA ligase subunit beta [Nitrospinota bacterium]